MTTLKVTKTHEDASTSIYKITGFTQAEFADLCDLPYQAMKAEVLDMLDERNKGLGTRWNNGYGVYQMWIIKGEAVYAEIGNTCD